MKNVTILLAVAAMLAVAGPAYGTLWTGGDTGLWNVSGNWDAGIPGSGDTAVVNDGTCTVANTGAVAYSLALQEWGGVGGKFVMAGGDLDVGYATYNGYNTGHPGFMTMSGGSFSSKYFIQGHSSSVGHITVVGAGADSIYLGSYETPGTNAGVLTFTLGGGTDPIQQIDINSARTDTTFVSTDLIVGGTATTGTYTILTFSSSVSGNFKSITKPDGWTVNTSTPGIVTVTVPEPATMVLLGIGGIGALIRRRRR